MRSAVVGNPGTMLHGKTCPCCTNVTKVGEAVLWHRLPAKNYHEDKLVMHVECLSAAIERAPEGRPTRGVKAEYARASRRIDELALVMVHQPSR